MGDNQHRQALQPLGCANASSKWAAEMKRVSAFRFGVGRTFGALFQAKMNAAAAALTTTDTHKSSSVVYGKIEGFTPPAV